MPTATVNSIEKLSSSVFLLRLKTDGELHFKAGQFIIVSIPQDPSAPEGSKIPKGFYSIASAEQDSQELELLIEHHEGYVSAWMTSRKAGDKLQFDGPMGKFGIHEAGNRTQIFLGFKAGLAPLRSMILSLINSGSNQHIHLFLGAEGTQGLFFDPQWRALEKSLEKFHYHPVVRPTPENPFIGKNQDPADELIKKMTHKSGHLIYIAGFNREVEPMFEKLVQAGFEKDFIKIEKFG
jgi:NAD(P)H-flavin reductase